MGGNRKWIFLFLSFSFLFPLLFYVLTTNPNVTFTDNGELIGVCITLGIAHPTGYPLFALLGHLWSVLPLPLSKSFQMNLLAAVWTAFSGMVFFLANVEFLKILRNDFLPTKIKSANPDASETFGIYLLSFISTLIYAFSRTIWGEATSLEVYSLQLLLFNLLFLFSFKLISSRNEPNLLIFTTFLLGLSFTNHLTTILFVPSFIFLLLFRSEKGVVLSLPKFKSLVALLIPFLLGLSLYAYLPLRSAQFPDFNWGWVSRSFDKFLYHVSGKQYRVWMFSSAETISTNFSKFISLLPFEFAYIGLAILLTGLIILLIKNKYIFLFLFLSLISCLIYSLNYQIHDIETYFSLGLIVLFFFFTAGTFYLWVKFKYIALATFVVPLLLLLINYKENDDSKNNLVLTYTKNIVENLEPNAVIISAQWDYFCSAFWYLQKVEHYRTDVVLVEKELLRRTWYSEQVRRWYPEVISRSNKEMADFLEQLELFESDRPYDPQMIQFRFEKLLESFVEKNIHERPIYITFDILQNEYDSRPFAKYEKVPQGFAIRLLDEYKDVPTDLDKIQIEPFERFSWKDDHLVKGIIQSTKANLSILGNYFKMTNKANLSARVEQMMSRLPSD